MRSIHVQDHSHLIKGCFHHFIYFKLFFFVQDIFYKAKSTRMKFKASETYKLLVTTSSDLQDNSLNALDLLLAVCFKTECTCYKPLVEIQRISSSENNLL